MRHGLKTRAEGGREPAWIEAAEIGLWLMTLAVGLARGAVPVPARMAPAVVAVAVLVALTFIQPAMWTRTIIHPLLLAGLPGDPAAAAR